MNIVQNSVEMEPNPIIEIGLAVVCEGITRKRECLNRIIVKNIENSLQIYCTYYSSVSCNSSFTDRAELRQICMLLRKINNMFDLSKR